MTDDATNINFYINGNLAGSHAQTGTWYVPDSWTPFQIGAGRGNSRDVNGIVDELAVYTNVLQDISDHYAAGTSTSPSPTYFQLVTNDNPVLYFRMDSLPYSAPPLASWPAITNYGSLASNGVYTPGTIPGLLAGPATLNGVPYAGLFGGNVPQLSGVSSYADVGDPSPLNPVGVQPFSVTLLFRGNPTDNRFQAMMGHSDNSWRLSMNTNGKLQSQLGTNSTSQVNSSKVYNDGRWHQLVEVYTPGSAPTVTGTNSMYVDGILDTQSTTVTTNGILPGSPLDVLIGADPQYTNNAAGVGRQFAGQVCEVAVFTNSLTAAQVATLYNSLGVPPSITQQPVSATVNQNSAFTNSIIATGGIPLSYQWYKDNAKLPVQTNASLILGSVQATDASTNYYVVVTNSFGATTSVVWTLTVETSPTILSQFPVPYTNLFTLYAGANPNFSVSVVGATPLSFQWFTNGVAVAGATNPVLTLNNVQIGSFNNYCLVTNVAGRATSMVYSATVVAAPTAPYPQSILASSPIAYWRLNERDDGLGDGNAGALSFDYAGGNDGIYTNVNLGQTGYNQFTDPGTTSAEFGETGLAFVDSYSGQIAGIDFGTPSGKNAVFSIEAWVNGFSSSQANGGGIITKGFGNGGEQFDLDVFGGTFRFFVRDAGGAVHGPTSAFKLDSNWHHVVGVCDEANSIVSLYVDGVLAGSSAVTPGSGLITSTNLMTIGSRTSTANTNYNLQFLGYINDVAIYNYALTSNQVVAHYTAAGVPPSIVQLPPATASANGGGTLVIPALAIGSTPLSYAWADQNGGTNVATGFTNADTLNATLNLSNLDGNLNGDTLQLIVSNTYGSTNYSVLLTVFTNAPVITRDLPFQVLRATGDPFTYSVGLVGPSPYSYQWYNVAGKVIGQTNATFTVAPGSAGNSSTYYVVITNIYGATTSSVSTFTAVTKLTNRYATNLLQFNPAGYWPLQETNAPAPIALETNYGTLGALGTAYYAITTANQNNVQFGQSGALSATGDNDPAVFFTNPSGTNYAFVPRATPALTLRPPFTMEVWIYSTSLAFSDLISESGNGLNSAVGGGNWGGPRLSYAGNNGGGPALQLYIANGNGTTRNDVTTPPNSLPTGQWHYCVATYDGTTTMLYVDSMLLANDSTTLAGGNTMAIDTWSPLTIGDGLWQGNPTRGYTGNIDEVAIYTNLLTGTQVTNHYLAGTTSGSNYTQTILNDSPLLYYRMDCAGYTNESSDLYPAAVNYGSASVDGDYLPGVVPGEVAGPPIAALGNTSLAAPVNGVLSCVDAGNDPAFNPTGKQPFTAMTWFKGNPADVRSQAIMGHGSVNWAMNLDGTTGRVIWNTYAGGQVTSTTVLNDGNWHFVAGVVDGTNSSLYVDGQLNNSAALTAGLTSEPTANLYLGGDADFTLVGSNQRNFGGVIAQAAFFTNALTAAQIQQIYNPIVPAPVISLAHSGNSVVITYTGVLRSATSVTGPYSIVPGASSPYMVPATSPQQYYRASSQ